MKCDVCNAEVRELRRGRCWGCYNRWVDGRPVGQGARCCICGERRREFLKSVELLGAWLPTCHSCAARATTLDGMPDTLTAIRAALDRERRHTPDRRAGNKDPRVFQYERRERDRRGAQPINDNAREDGQDEVWIDMADILDDLAVTELTAELERTNHSRPELTSIIDVRDLGWTASSQAAGALDGAVDFLDI